MILRKALSLLVYFFISYAAVINFLVNVISINGDNSDIIIIVMEIPQTELTNLLNGDKAT